MSHRIEEQYEISVPRDRVYFTKSCLDEVQTSSLPEAADALNIVCGVLTCGRKSILVADMPEVNTPGAKPYSGLTDSGICKTIIDNLYGTK